MSSPRVLDFDDDGVARCAAAAEAARAAAPSARTESATGQSHSHSPIRTGRLDQDRRYWNMTGPARVGFDEASPAMRFIGLAQARHRPGAHLSFSKFFPAAHMRQELVAPIAQQGDDHGRP